MEINTEQLARAIKEGDEKAFKQFYDAYFQRIFGFLRAMLRNSDDAEDVTSVAFIYVWDNRGKLRKPEQLKNWLYQVAKHRALDHLRKNKPNMLTASLEDLPEVKIDSGTNLEKNADDYFLALRAEHLLSFLKAEERAIIHLRFNEDLTFEDMAERLGSSVIAVRVRTHRIIKRLKKIAEDNKAEGLDAKAGREASMYD